MKRDRCGGWGGRGEETGGWDKEKRSVASHHCRWPWYQRDRKSSLTQDQFEIQTGLGLHLKPLCASMSVSTDKWRSLSLSRTLLSCKMGILRLLHTFLMTRKRKHMPSPESKCCWAPVDVIFPNAPLPVLWPNKAIFLFFFFCWGGFFFWVKFYSLRLVMGIFETLIIKHEVLRFTKIWL